jgi:hypothetical protein
MISDLLDGVTKLTNQWDGPISVYQSISLFNQVALIKLWHLWHDRLMKFKKIIISNTIEVYMKEVN